MNPIKYILILLIKVYQWVFSPLKTALFGAAGRCRFSPSCSGYALEAVSVHGAARGTWLACRRLCRCHPWGKFGPDPVPPAGHFRRRPPAVDHSCRSDGAIHPAPLTAPRAVR